MTARARQEVRASLAPRDAPHVSSGRSQELGRQNWADLAQEGKVLIGGWGCQQSEALALLAVGPSGSLCTSPRGHAAAVASSGFGWVQSSQGPMLPERGGAGAQWRGEKGSGPRNGAPGVGPGTAKASALSPAGATPEPAFTTLGGTHTWPAEGQRPRELSVVLTLPREPSERPGDPTRSWGARRLQGTDLVPGFFRPASEPRPLSTAESPDGGLPALLFLTHSFPGWLPVPGPAV